MSPKTAGEKRCTICNRLYADHGPERCQFCGRPMEHHADGDLKAEEAGRVRMARARQESGMHLDHIDRQVLQRAAA